MNVKAYEGWLGPRVDPLARLLGAAAQRRGVPAALAPSFPDVGRLAGALGLPILAQHADSEPAGARTGYLQVEALKAVGAAGAIVNHSEHPLPEAEIGLVVGRLKGAGLTAVLCARDAADVERLCRFAPPYLAVEPPELIGTDRSVSTARPQVIRDSAEIVRAKAPATRLLCGAGVHSRQDVARALELGSEGILVASAVCRARDPAAAIDELLAGFPVGPGGASGPT